MDIARVVAKLTAPMRRRLALMVGRCVLLTVNDAAGVQELQVRALAGEELDRVERFQEYGFTSRPHPGAEGAMVSVGGLRGHSLVVGVEDKRYRLTGLRSGEVAVHDDQGQIIHLKRSGIEIKTQQPQGVKIEAPKVHAITGQARIEAESACIDSGSITLGTADARPIARVGDKVRITTGSSAGLNGVIETGSGVAKSA